MLMLYLSMLDTSEDKSKFLELYTYYNQKMYGIAYGILGNIEDAEDIVQESMIIIIENFQAIGEIRNQRTWNYILTIVKNRAINLYHKKKRRNTVEYEEWNSLQDINEELLINEIIKMEEVDHLTQAILQLPDRVRDVLYLYYYMELTYREIAKLLGLSEENVRQIGRRGRIKLEEILTEG